MHDTRTVSHVIGDAPKRLRGLRQRAQLYCDRRLHLGELMADEAFISPINGEYSVWAAKFEDPFPAVYLRDLHGC